MTKKTIVVRRDENNKLAPAVVTEALLYEMLRSEVNEQKQPAKGA